MKSSNVTIQMKAIEQYFSVVVLFITLCKVVLTFGSVNEILQYDHWNEVFRQHFRRELRKENLSSIQLSTLDYKAVEQFARHTSHSPKS